MSLVWTVLKKDEEGIMEFTSAGIINPSLG